MVTIALSKGRIFEEVLPLFSAAGLSPLEHPDSSRKLIIGTNQADVEFLIVRATDVPTYVQHGGADIGVVGRDVLLEHGGDELYEPLDLGIAKCRLMVAGKPESVIESTSKLRVATKYVRCTREFFAARAQQVEIIKLYGSMELAPLSGLADLIVDVVDTGSTLKANGLQPLLHVADISSRLVVNRASMKVQHRRIKQLIDDISAVLPAGEHMKSSDT